MQYQQFRKARASLPASVTGKVFMNPMLTLGIPAHSMII
jgi:hypothetical protein